MIDNNKINTKLYPENFINELKELKSKKQLKMSNLPKFIFLCGKGINNNEVEKVNNRGKVQNFFRKRNKKDLLFIYAEKLWSLDTKKRIDLLTFEKYLAKLSDGIILFVESYGSACELGAFSMEDDLRPKMLVVIDKDYKEAKSFIQDGPVKKIINTNKNGIIYTDLLAIFSNQEMFEKLDRFLINRMCKINNDKDNIDLKSFIAELFELIYLLGPISSRDLIGIYKYIKDFDKFDRNISIKFVLDILREFELIEIRNGLLESRQQQYNKPFMFDMTRNQFNTLRAKFLARKYKFKEGIIA